MREGVSGRRGGVAELKVARRIGGRPHEGRLIAGNLVLPCALGRSGVTRRKREGDGATPAGRFELLYVYLRRGRAAKPRGVPARFVGREDKWCDDARSFLYNRPLRGPTRLSHERLWRPDGLYDVIGVLDYNIRPRVLGLGSAIFFHIASETLGPTAGCVALRPRDMARLLPRLSKGVQIVVGQGFE